MTNPMEKRFFFGLLLVVSALFVWILTPFFSAVFWALAITIVFYPIYTKLYKKMPQWPNMAAAITLLLCIVIVVIPITFTINSAVNQAVDVYQKFEQDDFNLQQQVDNIFNKVPLIGSWLEQQNLDANSMREKISDSASSGGKLLAQGTWSLGRSVFSLFIFTGIMLYVMFFLLRDGKGIITGLMKALPLGNDKERLLFDKFAEVTRATIKGNLVIGIIQGTLGGLAFWFLGIPAALLWGVVMTILSLIPIIGSGLIWGPVAIYMLLTGDIWQGFSLIIYGVAVIGLVDNFLRPILVGRDTRMPDYIVLLSTIGGLALFGAHGFVIGPIIAALFMVSWGIFMQEFQNVEPPEGLLQSDE
ncbi:MAG TPA: AI-2E family transporter [Cellvibrionaceae bacterium]